MASINELERLVLVEFRNHISDLELQDYESQKSDYFLIRWLRARDYDLVRSKAMLSNYLRYRQEESVDSMLSWEAPSIIQASAPYYVLGLDYENSPVLFVPFYKWRCRKVADLGLATEGVKYIMRIIEEMKSMSNGVNTPEGIPVTQFVVILDVLNVSMLNFSSFAVVDSLLKVAKNFESYHPESVKKFYITNAGRAFSTGFTLIKPILGSKTAEKFVILGTNEEICKEVLLKHLPGKILPPQCGGTNNIEDVGCCDVDDEEEEEMVLIAVNVGAGEKLLVNVGVGEGNSTILWAFKTEKYDISFGVTRDGKAYIENQKRDSHVEMQEGCICCDHPGDYIFTFDNSYSRKRSKALSYRIDVKSPSGLKQILFD